LYDLFERVIAKRLRVQDHTRADEQERNACHADIKSQPDSFMFAHQNA
jgi:hypothetical protein